MANNPRHTTGAASTFLLSGFAALCLDRATKVWAREALEPGAGVRWIVDGVLGLQLRFNQGASLSIGESVTWLFTLIGVLAAVAIPFFARGGSRLWLVIMGLVWGGALGNLADRLFDGPFGRGAVTDFIVYSSWFTGNVADIFLVVGVLALIALMAAGRAPEGLLAEGTDAKEAPRG